METAEKIEETLKAFILAEFLPGESAEELTKSTPLITGGVLDSLATLKLVAFIEERYKIQIEAHDVDVDHFNTLSGIENLVRSKLQSPNG
jgi:acyl carrier protein